jgi:hypothetical protein
MMRGGSAITVESSRIAAPSLFRNRQYVIANLRHDDPSNFKNEGTKRESY